MDDISEMCTFTSYESPMVTLIIDQGQVQVICYGYKNNAVHRQFDSGFSELSDWGRYNFPVIIP